ncbi:DUF222 domain-containing protein, partial [Rhodococcus sp. 06-469-3-2]|uniref:DUF222 domain-containing protein n=2 Tax=unclassified Rhodococcus (in: high G+C Gram-positive bacteria) TaxID=192944 RepID=UPI00211AC1A7
MKTWGDVFELKDQELVSKLADVSSHESTLAAARLALLAEIDRRGLAMKLGHSSVTRWYAKSVRITDGSATRQMELGQWLTQWPSVLDALAGGDIHAAHASAIADGYATVVVADPTLDEQRRDAVVAELLETAMRGTAGQVSSRAQALAHSAAEDARARHEQAEKKRLEQERAREQEQAGRADTSGSNDAGGSGDAGDAGGSGGPEPAGPEPVPSGPPPVPMAENPNLNRFDVHRLASGRFQLGGDVDRLLAEKLLTVLSTLTAPQPGPGGERDPRSPSKRRADALDRILDRHLRGGSRGSAGGSRASVHLIVPLRDLLSDRGNKETASAPTGSTTQATGADGGHRASESAGAHGNSRTSNADAGPDGGADGGHRVSESVGIDGGSRTEDTDAGPDRATGRGQRARGSSGAGDRSCTGDSPESRVGRSTDGGVAAGGSDAREKSVPEPGDADWPFHLDWTGPISRSLAELLTCDADLTPVIVDHHGVPLALGRTTRLATDD